MNEKPILFSPEMVKAILDGRKTQTRRIINPQPIIDEDSGYVYWKNSQIDIHNWEDSLIMFGCPYGKVGDILWVISFEKI